MVLVGIKIRGENSQVYLSYHLHEPNERRNKQILKLNYKPKRDQIEN